VKVCYIIGPIRSKWGLIGRLINVWRGRNAAVKLWKAGFAVICPHLNSFAIKISGVDEDEMVRLDCEILRRCDFVVVLPGFEKSRGAQAEIKSIEDERWLRSNENYPYVKNIYFLGGIQKAIDCEKD
jgi:hypothetical protein